MLLYPPVIFFTRAVVFVFMGGLTVWLMIKCGYQYTCSENGALLPWMSESNPVRYIACLKL